MATDMDEQNTGWDIQSATALYNIDRWGAGYFWIGANGRVQVNPAPGEGTSIEVLEVIEEARSRGLAFPLVIRFQDILWHRVRVINEAFRSAIKEAEYQAEYHGVFPIKVNQLREVVEEIVSAGESYGFGLEAGSKPELIAALAIKAEEGSLIICNGYKDAGFIETALLGRKLGKEVILVVEKLEELKMILAISKEHDVEPRIGLRLRLEAKGAGKWGSSGGGNAKFGLSTADLVEASAMLKAAGQADALRLVHFHVGSQIPDIVTVKRAVREAARFYAKLRSMGHGQLSHIDVGGGLGIDYDGSRTTFDSSMNYTLQEYARDVVYNLLEVCDSEGVPHPVIISESGRATVAHHAVLVVEAFGAIEKNRHAERVEAQPSDHQLVHDMLEIQSTLTKQNRLENLHDAQHIKEQSQTLFELGLLDLQNKARIETIYWQIAAAIVQLFKGMRYVPEEVKDLETSLSDQFICNFSVFQSLLDHWALGQLFPILPLHRLDEPPQRNATLVDITCDSDGKISKFIDLQDVKDTLPLHSLREGEPYYLGIFLIGAYQDIMGDIHNLFGRVNELHIFLDEDEDSGYYIEEVIDGSTIGQVLTLTQWDERELVRRMKKQVDLAIKRDRLKPKEGMKLLSRFERGLKDYTYLRLNGAQS